MVDLEYDPSSLCGAVDLRVARILEKYRRHTLDPSYLDHLQRWHGGIPGKQYFEAADGETYRVGRFLTLVDRESILDPPFQPSWEYRGQDRRIDWSIMTLIDQEGQSCRLLFSGEELWPFAALYFGDIHPDEMSLTDGNVELLAFLYEHGQSRPRIVVWLPHKASAEYARMEEIWRAWDGEQEIDEPVRYESFTVPVASDFDSFLSMLRSVP